MGTNILYEENYIYDWTSQDSSLYLHMDYGTRSHDINMTFQHFHQFYEIYFMLKGSANHLIEGEAFNLHPFDIVALKPHLLHETYYRINEPCQRIIFNFSYDGFMKNFPNTITMFNQIFENPLPIYRFDEKTNEDIIRNINDMYKLSKFTSPTPHLILNTHFIEILNIIASNLDNNFYTSESILSPTEQKMYTISSFIHNNYSEELSLDYLAEKFFIDPQYLSRRFKQTTGFTLIKYIQETRVKKAQQLLLDTNMTITDVVSNCGFGSLSQFNRVFNRVCNMSPSDYRKKHVLK